jgi:hypothetical protein
VNQANKKITGWLTPLNSAKTTLDFEIEKSNDRFLLLDYTIDITAPAFGSAWGLAINGKFVDAIELPNGGVTLQTGSGFEKLYKSSTSINLNFFGKFTAAWTDSVIGNSSLIYAGNNIFHLISNEGRQSLSSINKSKREVDMYFAAEADLSQTAPALATVNLHVILQATNNPSFGNFLATFVSLMTSGPDGALLAKQFQTMASQSNTTEVLHIILPKSAYQKLSSSELSAQGKPKDEAQDQKNYSAFSTACGDLIEDSSPASFSFQNQALSYTIWRNWNIASNDQWPAPASALPQRTNPGNRTTGMNFLNQQFPQSGSFAQGISYTLQAASDLMNFCADLQSLATLAAAETSLATWDSFVSRLKSIITNDVQQDFMVPAALALTRLCGGAAPNEVTGPAPSLTSKNSIALTLNYS